MLGVKLREVRGKKKRKRRKEEKRSSLFTSF